MENAVGFAGRNLMVPMPSVESFRASARVWLDACERIAGSDHCWIWIGNGVLDNSLEDESLFGEFLRTPVSEGGVESLVVGPPRIVVEVGA